MKKTFIVYLLLLLLLIPNASAWTCWECNIDTDEAACPECGYPQPTMIECSYCHELVQTDSYLCTACYLKLHLEPHLIFIGLDDPIETCRAEMGEVLATYDAPFSPELMHVNSFPMELDKEPLLAFGASLLTADSLQLPECMQGDWYISRSFDNRKADTYTAALNSICSQKNRSHITSISFIRAGLLYSFHYQNGKLISYELVLSQSDQPRNPATIRHVAPYTEWIYLDGSHFFDDEEETRIRINMAPEGLNEPMTRPFWTQDYEYSSGYFF